MVTNDGVENLTAQQSAGTDWSAILNASIRTFISWGIIIGLIAWKGASGVLCITPIAWLLAAWVGKLYVSRTHADPGHWIKDAAISGGIFGFLQGALFLVLGQVLMPLSPAEKANMLLLGAATTVICLAAGAGLCALVVRQQRKRILAAQ
jgi:tetrahydromethanopterin S-methyltransferase subunit D